jgi:hypothetical protein
MTKLITSEAADDGPKDTEREQDAEQPHEQSRRRKRGKIPDVEDCLAALASLAGAVAMGYLKPAQANPIRAIYADILRHHQKNESRNDRNGLSNADVVELMSQDPKMFSMLEPFLTDEQIDLVMKNAKEGGRGQA